MWQGTEVLNLYLLTTSQRKSVSRLETAKLDRVSWKYIYLCCDFSYLWKVLIQMLVCSVQFISVLDSRSKFRMLTDYFSAAYGVQQRKHQHGGSILGSVNLRVTFRISSRTPKFLDLIHWMVFDIIFYPMTVKIFTIFVWYGAKTMGTIILSLWDSH